MFTQESVSFHITWKEKIEMDEASGGTANQKPDWNVVKRG